MKAKKEPGKNKYSVFTKWRVMLNRALFQRDRNTARREIFWKPSVLQGLDIDQRISLYKIFYDTDYERDISNREFAISYNYANEKGSISIDYSSPPHGGDLPKSRKQYKLVKSMEKKVTMIQRYADVYWEFEGFDTYQYILKTLREKGAIGHARDYEYAMKDKETLSKFITRIYKQHSTTLKGINIFRNATFLGNTVGFIDFAHMKKRLKNRKIVDIESFFNEEFNEYRYFGDEDVLKIICFIYQSDKDILEEFYRIEECFRYYDEMNRYKRKDSCIYW